MKKLVLFVTLAFLTISINAQEIHWVSFEKAIELNKANPKFILIDIYTDWCGWCKKMDKDTYSNAVIINYINKHYYAVKLDGEEKENITFKNHVFKFKQDGKRKYHELPATLMSGKLSYPTTLFMNEKEELIDKIPGYLNTELMEKILAFHAIKDVKTKKWPAFEKNFKSKL
ncbi:MAG: DUF255 domain-containing protein [Polaribacter sp.]|nr:DUF255 domain-containing protein [Polaribacter sp.]